MRHAIRALALTAVAASAGTIGTSVAAAHQVGHHALGSAHRHGLPPVPTPAPRPLPGQPGLPPSHPFPPPPFPGQGGPSGEVFVQTNGQSGNAIDVFARSQDGTLTAAGTYPTGGLGGHAAGAEADYLASQDSLVYEPQQRTLLAVNAGSDTLSVFRVEGTHLALRQVLPSGGEFPVSLAVHNGLVYALNSGGAGSVAGFRLIGGLLWPIPGSERSLGLANAATPGFLESPGEVGFTPDGSQLLVTTKASTSTIDSFQVGWSGLLSAQPVANASSEPVPFAFTFTPAGQLVATQAGNSSLGTYRVSPGGTLTGIASVEDGQAAMCWIAVARGRYYVANAGSADISAYTISPSGKPALVGTTGVVASTDAGSIDLAASPDGSSLYVEAGAAGALDEFSVAADGSLTSIGKVTGLGTGIEGIATE